MTKIASSQLRLPFLQKGEQGRVLALRRRGERGMTLIEIMVVMIIIALLLGVMVGGSGQAGSARLKQGTTMIAGAVRVAFARASATSKPVRLVFDLEESAFWLEEGDAPMLVQSKDSTGGAAAATNVEASALAEAQRYSSGPKVARPTFKMVTETGFAVTGGSGKGPRKLPRNIHFRRIETDHDDAPVAQGRAYLYFWPGGQTERAQIQLRLGDADAENETDVLSLGVAPLTGAVSVKKGEVALTHPTTDEEASERTAPGGL